MRYFFCLLISCVIMIQVRAQQDSLKKSTVTLALLYNSNISYYGQQTTAAYPYVLGNITVKLPIGLYFSAGSYKLLNYGSGLSATDLGVGFDYPLNEKLTVGLAYTRSFFPSTSPLLAASNENDINLSFGYLGNLFDSSLSADYAFGKQQDIFLGLTVSKSIALGTFSNEKNALSITPAIEILAGTRRFYETYMIEQEKRANGKGKGVINAPNSTTPSTTVTEKNSFNLLSYNFKLPLSFSRASYLIEANYQFSILGSKATDDLRTNSSIFGLGFYYQF